MQILEELIAEAAVELANALPLPSLTAVADVIAGGKAREWGQIRDRVSHAVGNTAQRRHATAFLDTWEMVAPLLAPAVVAMALVTAGRSHQAHQAAQSVELVWTGPATKVVPVRRTDQALLQVIRHAQERLLVVSYAVYNIPAIGEALVDAADRGVEIRLLLETPDRLEGENTYDTLKALGPSIAERCDVYVWPVENRDKNVNGHCGILHVKAAVADANMLFLSSANLTEYAFSINMELGVLVTGSTIPRSVEMHFDELIEDGVVVRV